MSIQYFKKERGGVNPVGWVQPTIYKDPPKGIFTRKYEPVNVADVMYMYQADNPYGDPTRINEAIQMYARGQNPMVEVSYQNAGAGSTNTSLGNAMVSNPYKVEVVRPPIRPIEMDAPISAPRIHQNYSVTANPSIFPQSIATDYDKSNVRAMTTKYSNVAGNVWTNLNKDIQLAQERYADKIGKDLNVLLQGSIGPSASYNIDVTRDTTSKYITQTKNITPIASVAPVSFGNIVVYDPKTNTNLMVETKIKDKHAIAVTAAASAPLYFHTNDGQLIKLKDYDYKVVVAPTGNSEMIIYVRQPDVKLERNSPLYSAQAALSGREQYDLQRSYGSTIDLQQVMPLVSATSSVKLNNYNEAALRESYDPTKMHLDINLPMVTATSSVSLSGSHGYNEQGFRNGKITEQSRIDDRKGTYGNWGNDRTSKPDMSIRGLA